MHTDTPLAGHPSLALGLFGFTTGFAVTAGWVARVAWALTHDRCDQQHR